MINVAHIIVMIEHGMCQAECNLLLMESHNWIFHNIAQVQQFALANYLRMLVHH